MRFSFKWLAPLVSVALWTALVGASVAEAKTTKHAERSPASASTQKKKKAKGGKKAKKTKSAKAKKGAKGAKAKKHAKSKPKAAKHASRHQSHAPAHPIADGGQHLPVPSSGASDVGEVPHEQKSDLPPPNNGTLTD